MYDQRVTITEAVRHIQNEDYLLPAIQREIDWERDQITDQFDSVIQGYPIGTFLYWDIRDEHRDQYKMYVCNQEEIRGFSKLAGQEESRYLFGLGVVLPPTHE